MDENSRTLHKIYRISLAIALGYYLIVRVPTASATFDIHTVSAASVASASAGLTSKYVPEGAGQILTAITHGVGDIGGTVLGTATSIVRSLTTKASEKVGSYIVDSAVSRLVKQYDKLSDSQKKTIREYVCK